MNPETDTPLMIHDSRAKRLEQAAIAAYRAKFPKAPPWQELSDKTRLMWVFYVEKPAR